MIAKISDIGSDIGRCCDKNIGHWIGSEKPHRFSSIVVLPTILNQARNFQTGRKIFKPGAEERNQIQTGRTARLKWAG